MKILVGLMILVMIAFAFMTASNELVLYRKAVKGEVRYLVTKKRRNRRLLVSLLLTFEAILLLLGFFVVKFDRPGSALGFWIWPLVLIFLLGYLAVVDLRETRRDLDRIFYEACLHALDKAKRNKKQ